MKKYCHLSQFERDRIQALLKTKTKPAEIARILVRHKSTVLRELKKNRKRIKEKGRTGPYLASLAQRKADFRRLGAKSQWKKINQDNELREYIVEGLKRFWSPDEISGRMKRENQPFYASKTAIYQWLYSSWAQQYCVYLYSRRYGPRKRRGKKTERVLIPNRTSIHLRPMAANWETGHYEADTVVSGKKTGSKAALSVLFERQSRYTDFEKIPNLKPESNSWVQKEMMEKLTIVKTLTMDNGLENRDYETLKLWAFFCDPYASWQKAGIENANKMIRWFVPKGTDINKYSKEYLEWVKWILNNKPRKSLNYKTPLEIMIENNLLKVPFQTLEIKTPEVALRG
jgi:IS30 family transposase